MSDTGKIFIHTAMSLDGFIAGPGDDMRWIFDHWEESLDLREHIRLIGAVVMGRKTHEVDVRERPKPEKNFVYGGAYEGPVFVLSKEPNKRELDPKVTYRTGDIRDIIGEVRTAAGDGNILLLGAGVWKEGLEAGLVDEILVHIIPVMLGDGTRLYAVPGAEQVELELTESVQIGTVAQLRFKVK